MIHQHGPPWPPSVHDFYPPGVGSGPWITKITVLLWLGAAAVIVFFPVAYRRPQLVPNRPAPGVRVRHAHRELPRTRAGRPALRRVSAASTPGRCTARPRNFGAWPPVGKYL